MDRLPTNPDPDPVSALVGLLKPQAVLSKTVTGRGRWGVRYEAHGMPSFCIVLAGRCWLQVQGSLPEPLERGDFLLLTATPAFVISNEVGVPCRLGRPSASAVRHGELDGEADFEMLGGTFEVEQPNAALLLTLLPAKMHLQGVYAEATRLARTLDLIIDECAADRTAREMLLSRLVEILLIETLRRPTSGMSLPPTGLLAGLHDPKIALALRALHADVRHGWTVAGLAKHVGLSRAALARRFATTVGAPPMEYLARWRMGLAVDALTHREVSLERLAREIGFDSASAFSTAFSRRVGCAPATFARSRRGEL